MKLALIPFMGIFTRALLPVWNPALSWSWLVESDHSPIDFRMNSQLDRSHSFHYSLIALVWMWLANPSSKAKKTLKSFVCGNSLVGRNQTMSLPLRFPLSLILMKNNFTFLPPFLLLPVEFLLHFLFLEILFHWSFSQERHCHGIREKLKEVFPPLNSSLAS